MDKEAVVHIHNGILLSYKKNAFESVLMRRMKLEPTLQSEVSQKEKHQYNISMHMYGFYLFIYFIFLLFNLILFLNFT